MEKNKTAAIHLTQEQAVKVLEILVDHCDEYNYERKDGWGTIKPAIKAVHDALDASARDDLGKYTKDYIARYVAATETWTG